MPFSIFVKKQNFIKFLFRGNLVMGNQIFSWIFSKTTKYFCENLWNIFLACCVCFTRSWQFLEFKKFNLGKSASFQFSPRLSRKFSQFAYIFTGNFHENAHTKISIANLGSTLASLQDWARICKPYKKSRNRFPAWRAGIRQPYLTYRSARPQKLAESIPWNRFPGSLNTFGLSVSV